MRNIYCSRECPEQEPQQCLITKNQPKNYNYRVAAGWILEGVRRHSFLAAEHVSKRVFSLWIPLVDPVVLFTPMTLPRFWHHCVRPFRRIFGTSCGAEASAFSGSTTRQVSVVGRGRRAWKTEETGCTPLARPQIWHSFFPLRLVTENTPSAILAPA